MTEKQQGREHARRGLLKFPRYVRTHEDDEGRRTDDRSGLAIRTPADHHARDETA